MDRELDSLSLPYIVVGDCHEFSGAVGAGGYGNVKRNGKYINAHRQAFLEYNGFLPAIVRHSCDNKKCIRKEHLVSGTQLDNMQDMMERDRKPGTKIGAVEALAIIAEHKSCYGENARLAAKYGCSAQLIGKIVRGERKSWAKKL